MGMLDGMTEEQKKMLIAQMSMQMGGAMMGSGPAANRIGRGLYAGGDALNQGMHGIAQQQKVAMEQQAKQQEMMAKQDEAARKQQLVGTAGAHLEGGASPAAYRKAAVEYAKAGDYKAAETFNQIADKMESEYSTTPVVGMGPDGKPTFTQLGKRGEQRTVEGLVPPPDNQVVNLGNKQALVDKRTGQQGATFGIGQSPDSAASLGLQREKFNYEKGQDAAKAAERVNSGPFKDAGDQGKFIADIRKEYNSLEPVKNFRAAAPIVESAKNAPDTTAGDLDVIYAVGKALDPNSVVREGELNLVIKSGSPLQRFSGFTRYATTGKGRLPPEQRAELMSMLDGRVGQLKAAHDQAATPYVQQAQSLGLPLEQIFSDGRSAEKPAKVDQSKALSEARAAIAKGAPRDAVNKRLQEMGVNAKL